MPERSAPQYDVEGAPATPQYGPTLPYAYGEQSLMERRAGQDQAIQQAAQGQSMDLHDDGVMNLHQFAQSHDLSSLKHLHGIGQRVALGQKVGEAVRSHVDVQTGIYRVPVDPQLPTGRTSVDPDLGTGD